MECDITRFSLDIFLSTVSGCIYFILINVLLNPLFSDTIYLTQRTAFHHKTCYSAYKCDNFNLYVIHSGRIVTILIHEPTSALNKIYSEARIKPLRAYRTSPLRIT